MRHDRAADRPRSSRQRPSGLWRAAALVLLGGANSAGMVVHLDLQPAGMLKLRVDTGAVSCVLSPRVMSQMALRPSYLVEVVTAAGVRRVPAYRFPAARVGAVTVVDVEVLSYEVPGADGILGQSFLRHVAYLLDHRRRTIRLDPDGSLGGKLRGKRVPLEMIEGGLLTTASVDGATARLVLDSGATHPFFFKPLAPVSGEGMLTTSMGVVRVGVGTVRQLRVGGTVLPDVVFGMREMSRAADGVLPTSLFSTVYIDAGEGYAILQARE